MKKLLFTLFCLPITFISCQKCYECQYSNDGYNNSGDPIIIFGENEPYVEVCRDNFPNRETFKEYVSGMEANGFDCKSDLWN